MSHGQALLEHVERMPPNEALCFHTVDSDGFDRTMWHACACCDARGIGVIPLTELLGRGWSECLGVGWSGYEDSMRS